MTCTYCQSPTATGMHLCATCTAKLEDVLDRIPDALETVADTMARLDNTGGDGRSSGGKVEAVNLGAMEAKIDLDEKIHSWARLVLEHEDRDDLRSVEPLTYLRMSINEIRAQDFAGELLSELQDALDSALRAADRAPEIRTYGQCHVSYEDGTRCTGIIRGPKGGSLARCRECHGDHDVESLVDSKVKAAPDKRAPLSVVVKAINADRTRVKLATAKRWAERGQLVTDAMDDRGVKVYTMRQVMDVAAMMATRRTVG